MSAPIGVGDYVERDGSLPGSRVSKGTVARVLAVRWESHVCAGCLVSGPGLMLKVPVPGCEDVWICPEHWRPIYRPKSDLIERLMQPVPGSKPEVA